MNRRLVCVGGPCAGLVLDVGPGITAKVACKREPLSTYHRTIFDPTATLITTANYEVDCVNFPDGDKQEFLRWDGITPWGAVHELISFYGSADR